ncbi:extracellular solute-binding protein [Paenibacillus tianjinensis]|uniref:Extracellular solute-binding protein n=1 Tax=Paenibacillus tianjinensis TaxID=2810347 RepID=A0ABX7LDC7_9BACL|nr:extracellular solute-binding protein [Paenibacillus tianjinensis]QSF46125.1 extracellular solute-binding protein [Paenibacillus tianjinensis]
MRKKLNMLLGSALMMLLLSACANSAADKVELTFWTTTDKGEQTDFLQQRIDAYNAEHPNVKVTLAPVDFSTASNQFKSALLSGEKVDIFRSDNSWIPEFADLGLLYPLDELASDKDRASYVTSALQSNEYQGSLYGLPSVLEAPALLYNKRILHEAGYSSPPATMDELLQIAKKVSSKDRYGVYLNNDAYYALPYLWAFGGSTITDDKKIELTSANSISALSFMLQLKQEGATQKYPDFSDSYSRMMQDFSEGKSAMIINGPWAVLEILEGSEFKDADNLGIAQIPAGPNGQGSPIGGHSFVVSNYSDYPEEAYEVIKYLTSEEIQLLQSERLRTLPTQTSVYQNQKLADDPIIQGFKDQVDVAKARPLIPEGSQMFNDFTPNLTDILLGKQSVQAGVQKIEQAWKLMLNIE